MKRLFGLLVLLLSAITTSAQIGQRQFTTAVVANDQGIGNVGSGIAYHQITWNPVGSVPTCSVKLQSSADNITYTDLITSQTCTSAGQSTVVNAVVNYIKIEVTAKTGSGTVTVLWNGFDSSPSGGGGTVTSITATSPITVTPNPITGAGDIECPTCTTSAGGGSVNGTVGQIGLFTGTNVLGGSAALTSPAAGRVTSIVPTNAGFGFPFPSPSFTFTNTSAPAGLVAQLSIANAGYAGLWMGTSGQHSGNVYWSDTTTGSLVLDSNNLGSGQASEMTINGDGTIILNGDEGGSLSGPSVSVIEGFASDFYGTTQNCANAGGTCAQAAAGAVTVAAGATTVTVLTSVVTANSEIFLQYDSSMGARLGVTCNTTVAIPSVTARTPGVSFTISVPAAPITNPACYSFHILN